MDTLAQGIFAQAPLWSSAACLPFGLGLFACGFRIRALSTALLAFVAGGLLLTQFCWYFQYLKIDWTQVLADLPAAQWYAYLPTGIGAALMLAFLSCLFRKEYRDGIF